MDVRAEEARFQALLLEKYKSPKLAIAAVAKNGVMGKRMLKKLSKKLGVSLSAACKKRLKRKGQSAEAFVALWGAPQQEPSADADGKPSSSSLLEGSVLGLAPLPYDCPSLPTSYRSRPDMERALLAALLATGTQGTARATSITAPKSRVSSQG